jgi:hypothetical protein
MRAPWSATHPTTRATIAARRCDSMNAHTTGMTSTVNDHRRRAGHRKVQAASRKMMKAFMWIVAPCSERLSIASRSAAGSRE